MLLCIIKGPTWIWSFIGLIVVMVLVFVVTGYVLKFPCSASFLYGSLRVKKWDVVVITLAREMIVFNDWQQVSVIIGVGCFSIRKVLSCC